MDTVWGNCPNGPPGVLALTDHDRPTRGAPVPAQKRPVPVAVGASASADTITGMRWARGRSGAGRVHALLRVEESEGQE